MLRSLIVVIVVIVAFALVGCGGGSDSTITPITSPLAGTWKGTVDYDGALLVEAERVIEMIVDTEGKVTGKITGVLPDVVTFSGTVTNGGSLIITDANNAVISGDLDYKAPPVPDDGKDYLNFSTGTRVSGVETKTGVIMDIER